MIVTGDSEDSKTILCLRAIISLNMLFLNRWEKNNSIHFLKCSDFKALSHFSCINCSVSNFADRLGFLSASISAEP